MTTTQELVNALALLSPDEEKRFASELLDELKWLITQQNSSNFLTNLEQEIENEISEGNILDLDK